MHSENRPNAIYVKNEGSDDKITTQAKDNRCTETRAAIKKGAKANEEDEDVTW